ncbi:iron complex outermembrane recepter protein [Sphingomonas guangdongensis]|uniref:Iron complex outermembrane recepter protein n=1 Tax=Sphingomonas guangdongensis TaxID=1141890 RepID=A0A285R7J6_9SPHN|nr:TonB-dependent receptor [Sphingomonas guangdongensis]SOB88352.1 iron complex outermembrane recepter protein [Sphingomonas guangdongensis]
MQKFMSAAAAAGALLPLPSSAQTDGQAPTAARDRLPEVIVTARRRAEYARAVPAALSVVSGDLLDQSYTVNTQALTTLIPSLNYSSANPRNTALTIRGLGSSVVAVSQSNDGLEPGVGFYVDQVYHARPATAAFDFADIAQVEELRGPQGTLFGKNTTAGALNITSRAPTFTNERFAELSYGDFDFVQARAWVSGPITDTIAFRLSGVATRRDGVLENVRTGRDANLLGTQAVRGQLLFKPVDTFQMRLIGDFTNFQAFCCTQGFVRVGTSQRAAARQFGGPAGLAAQFRYAPPSIDIYDRRIEIDGPLGVDTNEGGLSAITDWDVGFGTITSVTAWRFWNWDAENDRDYTGLPIQLSQHIPSRQDQHSQELRLASNGEDRLSYVVGLYGFSQRITGRPISIYGPAAARYLIGTATGTGAGATAVPANLLDGYGQDGRTDFRTLSLAAFGEVNWRIVDAITLTGGLRYTHEDKDGYYATYTYGGPALTGTAAQRTALLNAQLGVLRGQSYAADDKDGSLSGRGNVAWQVTDAVLGYASYARGFKSGGINMSGLPLDAANQPALNAAVVRPERNTTYEVGLKTRLFDGRVSVNIDGFYTEVRDFQATIVDTGPTQTAALRGYLSNIPEVTVEGIEADVAALIVPGLTARASVAYADGEYSDYPAGPCPLELQTAATAACDLTGRRLASLPRIAVTAGLDYERAVGSGAVFAHVDTASRSGFNGDPALSRFTYIDGYNLTNANIGYRFASGIEVAGFARNLFDADYLQNVTVQAGNSGLILGTPSDPRVIGGTVRFRR